ncbi:two-component sensor histidine kinase [Drancourtella sp. An210]|uniref:histidine kinase n=2 Tax=Sellimonas caecigallum TaxID=2592333 RepID=A0ABS7L6K3_9FIRM|nr:HAMP domain-containing histidine kinase [Sellimonas caecigallum]OUP00965.1 two-component sensor histidine kinase [Drancourtella sp. An210]OUP63236.1 two-component sensor histidine kinase [Drancourtella sp. An177]
MRRRYKDIESLTQQIDRILHGEEHLELGEFREGDLEILKDEIYKMTVRLREQNEKAKQEKVFLADALADISHQIRTPLTSLNIMLERMKQADMSEIQRKKSCRDMERMLGRMEWLITALLKMSKLDAGTVRLEKKRILAKDFVKEAVRPLEIPMELKGQTLLLKGEGDVTFQGDEAWTMEALGNVLKNCMEHTPSGGMIQIEWRENPLFTEIAVSDSGDGIAKEDLPHIFERFYRGRQSDNVNFGIGLALARSILSGEDAVITAENRKEGGARFRIRFYKRDEM